MVRTSAFRRTGFALLAILLTASFAVAAQPKKGKPGKKPKPKAPAASPSKPAFDKIVCVITGGSAGLPAPEDAAKERYEGLQVSSDGKYELRGSKDGTARSGSLTKGQMEGLKKKVGEVNWASVKEKYEGAADGAVAELTMIFGGKTRKTRVPLDEPLLPNMKSDVPEGLTAVVDEMSGLYKRYVAGDRKPGKARPKKAKKNK